MSTVLISCDIQSLTWYGDEIVVTWANWEGYNKQQIIPFATNQARLVSPRVFLLENASPNNKQNKQTKYKLDGSTDQALLICKKQKYIFSLSLLNVQTKV